MSCMLCWHLVMLYILCCQTFRDCSISGGNGSSGSGSLQFRLDFFSLGAGQRHHSVGWSQLRGGRTSTMVKREIIISSPMEQAPLALGRYEVKRRDPTGRWFGRISSRSTTTSGTSNGSTSSTSTTDNINSISSEVVLLVDVLARGKRAKSPTRTATRSIAGAACRCSGSAGPSSPSTSTTNPQGSAQRQARGA